MNKEDRKNQLMKRHGNKCYICESSENLQVSYVIPKSIGGTDKIENLRLVCPICHTILDKGSLREFEFEKYLQRLISSNHDFKNTFPQKLIGNNSKYRIDIYTEYDKQKLHIEAKAFSYIEQNKTERIVKQIQKYTTIDSKLVFAFPGILSEEQIPIFQKYGIEVWDIPKTLEIFKNQIESEFHPVFKPLYLSHSNDSIEDKLIEKLKAVKPGKDDWPLYQKLLNDILERLFVPLLEKPLYEQSDESKVNRRDYIIPNYCESGFWKYMRDRYQADFIVIDAKNYTKNVGKKDILQISNYLKTHGTGKFGIIITRKGIKNSGSVTRKEVWILHNKLIIVLTDEDIIQMLTLKSVGNRPEDLLKNKIEQFRLSI